MPELAFSPDTHAYTLHLVDGTADYPSDNWLRRAEPPTGFSPS